MSPTVLLVGLPWDHHTIAAKYDANVIRMNLEQTELTMKDAGYDYKPCYIEPEEGMTPLIDVLKHKHWDGVVVGFGVRGEPSLTVFFEQIVNVVREHSPTTKLLFNTSPGSTIDAAKRWLPIS